jgi:hypothetical protein
MTKWTTVELPKDPDTALICVYTATLFNIIGTVFSITSETRDQIYQNKKAGLSTLSFVLHSSFKTSLPQVLGNKNLVGGEDKGVLLPCAKTYSEWYSDNEGIFSGVKPLTEEGLKTQIIFTKEPSRKWATLIQPPPPSLPPCSIFLSSFVMPY